MKVLGIDPGYDRLGVAVVEQHNQDGVVVFSECFETDARAAHAVRLAALSDEVGRVITQYQPDALAIETLFFSVNKKTALKVAEARGAVLAAAAQHGLAVYEYAPGTIKTAITGHGGSDKQHLMAMLPHLVSLSKEITHDDEYDAIAVSLTWCAIENRHHT